MGCALREVLSRMAVRVATMWLSRLPWGKEIGIIVWDAKRGLRGNRQMVCVMLLTVSPETHCGGIAKTAQFTTRYLWILLSQKIIVYHSFVMIITWIGLFVLMGLQSVVHTLNFLTQLSSGIVPQLTLMDLAGFVKIIGIQIKILNISSVILTIVEILPNLIALNVVQASWRTRDIRVHVLLNIVLIISLMEAVEYVKVPTT